MLNDDHNENAVSSNAVSPTPTPIASDANMPATTGNATPDTANSVTPPTNTGKKKKKKFDTETIISNNKERTESLTSSVKEITEHQDTGMSAKIDMEKDKLAFHREKMEKQVNFVREKIALEMKNQTLTSYYRLRKRR